MLTRCYAITLNTRDWDATRRFYVDALGIPVATERPNVSFTLDIAGISVTFEVFYRQSDSFAELYFETEDVPHFCKRLRAAGHDVPHEWADKAELRDPDGRRIIVTQRF